jgi:hypothetical protein
VHMNTIVMCGVPPCSLVKTHPRFEGTCGFRYLGEKVRTGLELCAA